MAFVQHQNSPDEDRLALDEGQWIVTRTNNSTSTCSPSCSISRTIQRQWYQKYPHSMIVKAVTADWGVWSVAIIVSIHHRFRCTDDSLSSGKIDRVGYTVNYKLLRKLPCSAQYVTIINAKSSIKNNWRTNGTYRNLRLITMIKNWLDCVRNLEERVSCVEANWLGQHTDPLYKTEETSRYQTFPFFFTTFLLSSFPPSLPPHYNI